MDNDELYAVMHHISQDDIKRVYKSKIHLFKAKVIKEALSYAFQIRFAYVSDSLKTPSLEFVKCV